MLLISHRGNVSGRNPERENSISYIQEAIDLGYVVEVDLWVANGGKFYLAHDYHGIGGHGNTLFYGFKNSEIEPSFLEKNLLIHCKNVEAVQACMEIGRLNFFFHENEKFTISSRGWTISHSKNKPTKGSIHMLPELGGYSKESLKNCAGICSDIISFYA